MTHQVRAAREPKYARMINQSRVAMAGAKLHRPRRAVNQRKRYIRPVASLPPPSVLDAVRAALARDGTPVDPRVLDEFVGHLDPGYFAEEAPEDVATHVRMAAELGPSREAGRYDVAVVAFDYFAEFSILCGLLAAHRLSIESGHVHTFGPARKIVDVFGVVPWGA